MSATVERIIKSLENYSEPLLAEMGLELVEVQFRREGHGWVLRFTIDSEEGITLDDCAAFSREISAYLEVEDMIDHTYNLEVSSPGLERPLIRRRDFDRFAGRKAKIKMHQAIDGQKVFIGILNGLDGESVVLMVDEVPVKLDLEGISRARLVF